MVDPALNDAVARAVQSGKLTPDEALQYLQPAAPTTLADVGERAVKGVAALGTGITDAAAGTVGLPGDLWNWLAPKVWSVAPHAGGSQDIKDVLSGITGLNTYQPENKAEQYIRSAGEGAASFFNPISPTKAQIALGIASGLGGQIGEDVTKAPYGRFVGSVLPASLGLLSLRANQATRTLNRGFKEMSPEELSAAIGKQAESSRVIGAPSLLTSNMDQNRLLPNIVADVGRSPEGTAIRDAAAREGAGAQTALDQTLSSVSPADSSLDTARRIMRAGEAATYTNPRQAVTNATQGAYQAADASRVSVQPIVVGLAQEINKRRFAGDKAQAVAGLAQKLLDNADAAGMINARTASDLVNEAYTRAGARVSAADASAAGGHKLAAAYTNDALHAASPELATADALHAAETEATVTPRTRGVMGAAFPEGQVNSGAAKWGTMTAPLKSPDTTAREVAMMADGMRAEDPGAFPALVKQSMVEQTRGQSIGAAATAVAGAPGTPLREQFTMKMQKTYEANGLSPADAALASQGANTVMDVLQRVGKGQETLAGRPATDVSRLAGESFLGNIGKVFHPEGFVRQWAGINIAEAALKRHTFEHLAVALTDPAHMKDLMEMARFDARKNAGQVIAWVAKNAIVTSHLGRSENVEK